MPHSVKEPRLTLQAASSTYFDDLIKALIESTAFQDPQTRVEARLCDAATFFQSKLADYSIEKLKNVRELLFGNFQMIQLTVHSSSDVALMFEVVNNRGLALDEFDKIKNWLLRVARIELKMPELSFKILEMWAALFANVEKAGLPRDDFLLKYYWVAKYNPDDERNWQPQQASDAVRTLFTKPKARLVRSYVRGLRDSAWALAQFPMQPRKLECVAADCEDKSTQAQLRKLWHDLLEMDDFPQAAVLAIAVVLNFGRAKNGGYAAAWKPLVVALSALRLYRIRFCLYRPAAGQRRAGKSHLLKSINRLAHGQELSEWVSEVTSQCAKFCDTSCPLRFDDWGASPKISKLILWWYEEHLSQKLLPTEHFSNYTIEHIYPVNAREEEWPSWSPKDDALRGDIGNLALVSREQNSSLGNKRFADKKGCRASQTPCYSKSNWETVRKLADNINWAPIEVRTRHIELEAFLREYVDFSEVQLLAGAGPTDTDTMDVAMEAEIEVDDDSGPFNG